MITIVFESTIYYINNIFKFKYIILDAIMLLVMLIVSIVAAVRANQVASGNISDEQYRSGSLEAAAVNLSLFIYHFKFWSNFFFFILRYLASFQLYCSWNSSYFTLDQYSTKTLIKSKNSFLFFFLLKFLKFCK